MRANDNQPKIYNEYRQFKIDGEVVEEKLTKRGHVSITERDAEIMNEMSSKSGLIYKLAEQPKDERKELFTKAKKLGLKPAKNISTDDLKELINKQE